MDYYQVVIRGPMLSIPHEQIDYEKNILSDAHLSVSLETPTSVFHQCCWRKCPWNSQHWMIDWSPCIPLGFHSVLSSSETKQCDNVLFDKVNMRTSGPNGFSLSVYASSPHKRSIDLGLHRVAGTLMTPKFGLWVIMWKETCRKWLMPLCMFVCCISAQSFSL